MHSLANDSYTLGFSDDYRRLEYLGKSTNLLSENQPPIFEVCFLNSAGKSVVFTSDQARKTECNDNGKRKTVKYHDFGEVSLTVVLSVEFNQNDSLFHWQIAVNSDFGQLHWIQAPCLKVKDNFEDSPISGNNSIMLPYNEGVLVKNIDFRKTHGWHFHEPEYPSAGNYSMCPGMMSTPIMAVISESGSLYFAAHDREQKTRCLDFFRQDDGIYLLLRLYPGISGSSYCSPDDTVLGVFSGDWYAASEIYRNWFEKYGSSGFVPISENKDLPDWYDESPVVVAYPVRGHHDTDDMSPNRLFPYINGIKYIKEISEKTSSNVMALLMHWEGTAPWAPPYVWPPYGGENALGEFRDALHTSGNYLGLYCSGLGYTKKSNLVDYNCESIIDKDKLKSFFCAPADGSEPISQICTAQRSGYDLCPATDFCRETIISETKKIKDFGVDYIQLMDQNHGGTPYFCYSQKHGHPPVPGKWESDALKEILEDINKYLPERKVLIGCESAAAETFIPHLQFSDNRFELNYLLGEPIPLYSFLYHKYLNNFMGNQVLAEEIFDCRQSKDNLMFRLAYSFVAGDFLTIVIGDDGGVLWAWGQKDFSSDYMPDTDEVLSFVKTLNEWRTGFAKQYLHTGKMIQPLNILCDNQKTIIAGRRKFNVPAVLTSRFESSCGHKGQILVNYTHEKATVKCDGCEGKKIYKDPINSDFEFVTGSYVEIPPLTAYLIEE